MISFQHHVDSIDYDSNHILVALSSLDGNVWDGAIKILSIDSGDEVTTMPCPVGITQIRYFGTQKTGVVACRDDGQLTLFSCNQNSVTQPISHSTTFQAHDDIISGVGLSKLTPNQILSCGWDGSIHCWDVNHLISNNISSSSSSSLASHSNININNTSSIISFTHAHYGSINDISCSTHDSSLFVTVGNDGFARTWDTRQNSNKENGGCLIFDLQEHGSAVLWDTQNMNHIIVGTDAGDLLTFDCRKAMPSSSSSSSACHNDDDDNDDLIYKTQAHQGRVRRVISHPTQSGVILTASDDTTIAIFESNFMNINMKENTNNDRLFRQYKNLNRFSVHTDYVTDIAVMILPEEDGSYEEMVISTSTDKTLRKTSIFQYNVHD